ncbi:hypothetical protein IL306_005101 [Fusarium sp. DS 682]|nr:hypothetical protein IL306_005101 [Fusarium sp. DS 682]
MSFREALHEKIQDARERLQAIRDNFRNTSQARQGPIQHEKSLGQVRQITQRRVEPSIDVLVAAQRIRETRDSAKEVVPANNEN